ncbi:MAG TPA: hypothetical protein PK156_18470, partial [Polyangium sp.]|nr:hypothetical protein [Polyangium sp.]
PIPPTQVRPDVPPAFEAIILKCLEKRPEHRYQSVQELMAHLLPYAHVVAPPLSAIRASAPSVAAFSIGAGQAIAAPAPKPVPHTKTLVMGAQLSISNTDPSTPPPHTAPHPASAAPSTTAVPEGVTAGAWGQTSGNAGAKDKKSFLLGALACVLVLSVGGIIAVVRAMLDQPAGPVAAAASAMPVGPPNPSAMQPIQAPVPEVVPMPTNGPGVEAALAEPAKPETTTAQPKSTAKTAGTTAPGKAATTTKKPSIADFND